MTLQHKAAAPLAVVRKNKAEQVNIALSEFKGVDLIDVRTYYLDPKGELRATPKAFACGSSCCPI